MKYYLEIFGHDTSVMPQSEKGATGNSIRFEITEDLDPINLLEYLKASIRDGVIGFISDAENKLVVVPTTSISCVEVRFSKTDNKKMVLKTDTKKHKAV